MLMDAYYSSAEAVIGLSLLVMGQIRIYYSIQLYVIQVHGY